MQDDQAVDRHEAAKQLLQQQETERARELHAVASKQLNNINESQARVREINAKAELLEAQALDVRAQARHRTIVCESMEIVNKLQSLQINSQIDELNKLIAQGVPLPPLKN